MDVHVVLKGVLHDCQLPTYLSDLSGVVIVEHKFGLIQKERPHYHCWIPGVSRLSQFKADLRGYYDGLIPDLKWNTHANAYWTVKEHGSFESWLNYVLNEECKSPTVVVWNRSGPRPVSPDVSRSIDDLIIPANVVTEVPVVKSPESSRSKKEPCYKRFINYLNSQNVRNPTLDECLEYWFEWTNGNYELRNVSGPVRHAYYVLNDKDPDIRKMFVREMRRKLFSDV